MSSGATFVRRRGTTAVPNATVHDDRLSFQALGILVVVLGRKANHAGNGYRHFLGRGMGRDAILRAFKELEAAGYRHQFQRRKGGKFVTDTIWSETPLDPAQAAAWWSKQTGGTEPSEKTTTVRRNQRTDRAPKSVHAPCSENRAPFSGASSVPEAQGSSIRFAHTEEPGEPKRAQGAEQEPAPANNGETPPPIQRDPEAAKRGAAIARAVLKQKAAAS